MTQATNFKPEILGVPYKIKLWSITCADTVSGFVPAEAFDTFTRKNRALLRALNCKDAGDQAGLERNMRTIRRCNSQIRAKGWYLLSEQFVSAYPDRYEVVG